MQQLDVRALADGHFVRIHRAALVLTGNPWDADDLTQETFLAAARACDRFEGRSRVYTWLYGIMLNLDRRERRRRGRHASRLRVVWDRGSSARRTAPAAETPLEVEEWKRSLWSYVARLPDPQRQALVLRYSEHLSYDEIAEAMECPLGTVKSRIFNALAALRKLLATEGDVVRLVPPPPHEDLSHAV